jgi:hypothetical protein
MPAGFAHSVPFLIFALHENAELCRHGAVDNDSDGDQAPPGFVIGNE